MMKKLKALAVTAAAVAALGAGAGAAHADAAQPAGSGDTAVCRHPHTYQDGDGLYLEVHGWGGKGAVVDTWTYADQNGHAQDNERWCLEAANEGGYYFHPAYNWGLCLDVPGAAYANTNMVVWACNGRENQRFTISNGTTSGYISPISTQGNMFALQSEGFNNQVTLDAISNGNDTYWQ